MNRVARIAVVTASAILVVALGGGATKRYYLDPVAEREARIAASTSRLQEFERRLDAESRVRSQLDQFAQTTLGQDSEEITHRLRSLVTELAEAQGLTGIVVTTGRTGGISSPVRAARVRNKSLREALLGSGPQFGVVSGRVEGRGDLSQVLGTLASAEGQSWLHRVDGFAIEPVGDERTLFTLKLDFSSVVVPDLARGTESTLSVTELGDAARAQIGEIVTKNIFKRPEKPEPEPETAPVPEEPVQPEPPAPPPYQFWRITGLVESTDVVVMLQNTASGARLILGRGDRVENAEFRGGTGEVAIFHLDGNDVEVNVGDTLAQRRVRVGDH